RQSAAVHVAALENECVVIISELLHNFCGINCFALNEGKCGWAGEVFVKAFDASFVGSDLEEGVLGDGVINIKAQVGAQLLKLCNGQAAVLGDDDGGRCSDLLLQLSQFRSVLWVCHFLTRLLSKHLFCSAGANLMTGIKKPRARARGTQSSQTND